MIFTDIDRETMQLLSTVVKLAESAEVKKESIVNVGQHLGVPKDDTIGLIAEWEEQDVLCLESEAEKQRFFNQCFSFMKNNYTPSRSELELYDHVASNLGLRARSSN